VAYVDANGLHTYYGEAGSGDPLLLLHGGLVDGDSFAQQTPAFAERFRVIVPDRRGHGRSVIPPFSPTAEVVANRQRLWS